MILKIKINYKEGYDMGNIIQQRHGEQDYLNLFVKENLTGKKDLIGIEIGCYRGESTEMFLKSGAFKTLYCIDPWLPGYDNKDLASFTDFNLVEADFDNRLEKYKDIVKKIKAKSTDVVNFFDDGSIDFIYIDGCHQYEAVIEDLKNYFPKIKAGGMVCGHDYHYVDFPGVTKAIDEFFKKPPLKEYPEHSWIHIKE